MSARAQRRRPKRNLHNPRIHLEDRFPRGEAGGTLEEAANLANYADMRTTRFYDVGDRVIRLTSVERIVY